MAHAVVYCDRCGKLVAPSDVEAGRALVGDAGAMCPSCLSALTPDERDAMETRLLGAARAPAAAGTSGSALRRTEGAAQPRAARRARPAAGAARERTRGAPARRSARPPAKAGGSGTQSKVFIAASVGGVVLGVVAVALLRSGNGKDTRRATGQPKQRQPRASAPVTPPPAQPPRPAQAAEPAQPAQPVMPPPVEPRAPEPKAPGPPPARPAAYDADDWRGQMAGGMLDEARRYGKANAADVHGYRAKLRYVVSNFGGTKAAVEAARVLKEEARLPELPPERDPKPPGDDAWKNAVSVLPSVDTSADRLKGNWRLDGGRLRSDRGMWAKIGLPYLLPDEYDVRVTFERVENADCLLVILARGGRPFIFSIGGNGNTGCSFEDIRESGPDVLPTKITRTEVLPRDGRHTAVILVRSKCLRAYVDGRPTVGCQVDDDGLSLPSELRTARTGQLGLATWNTVFVFHSLEVLPVSGEGELLREP